MRASVKCRTVGRAIAPRRPSLLHRHRCLSKETPLVLHVGESTVEVPFSVDEVRNLGRSFNALLKTFKDKQAAQTSQKWDLMRYSYRSDGVNDDPVSSFEVVCNPNAYPAAFDAKLMISLESRNGVKFTGEAHLSQTKSDLQQYIADYVNPQS